MTKARHNAESLEPLYEGKEMDFEKYKPDAAGNLPLVLVNYEGTWQALQLLAEPHMRRNECIVEVEVAGTPTTLSLDYAPQVVEFDRGDNFDTNTIIDNRVRSDGRIEYDLYDSHEDREILGVPQELLSAWRKALVLQDETIQLGAQIATIQHADTDALTQKRLAAGKVITTLIAEIGTPGTMQDLGKRALAKKMGEIETLFAQANATVKELREAIAAAPPDTRGLKNYTHFEHLTEVERQERKALAERIKKEITERTHEIKEEANKKEEEALEKKIKAEVKSIKKEAKVEDAALENRYNVFLGEVNIARLDWATMNAASKKAFWDGRSREGKKAAGFKNNSTMPEIPPAYVSQFDDLVKEKSKNLSKIKLSDKEKAQFEKMRKNAELSAYFEIIQALQKLGGHNEDELIGELEHRRHAAAAVALTGDIQMYPLIDYVAGSQIQRMDHSTTPPTPLEVKDYNTTGDELSTCNKKNIEFLKEILTEWGKAEKQKFPDTAEVFDFEKESTSVESRIKAALDSIPKQASGAPVAAYQHIFDQLSDPTVGLQHLFSEQKEHYKNIQSISEYTLNLSSTPPFPNTHLENFFNSATRENFTKARRCLIDETNIALDSIEEQIRTVKNLEVSDKARTEFEKHENDEITRKQREIRDYEGDSLTLTAEHLRDVLAPHHDRVGDIMRKLYEQAALSYTNEGQLEIGKTTLTNDVIDDFKKLFDGTSVDFARATIRRIWPEAGVKDFEKFQHLWKEKLAGEVAKSFKVLAEETLTKKTAEKMEGFRAGLARAGKMKGALALRMVMTIGLVGAGAATGGLAAGALGLAGAAGAVVGGATGGAIRGWLNKSVFGKMFEKNIQSANSELLDKSKRDSINELLTQNYSASWGDPGKVEGLDQFSTILTQTIREFGEQAKNTAGSLTPEEQTALIDSGNFSELVSKFSVNEKRVYLDTLAAMAEQHPSEKQKFDLARAIFVMRDHGHALHERAMQDKNIDPMVVSTLDRIVSSYSGRRGIGAAALSGGVIAGVFASHEYLDNIFSGVEGSTLARGTLGGIMGAVQGYRFMEGIRQQQEREAAKAELFRNMSVIRNAVISVHSGGYNVIRLAQGIREEMTGLKRLLHGTGTQYEVGAVVNIKQLGKDKQAAYPDSMLIKQIQGLVYEAESLGLWIERVEERRNLGAALDLMKKHGDEVETQAKDKTRSGVWHGFKKNVLWRGGGIVGGAAIGAATAILIGKYVAPYAREGARIAGEKLHIIDPLKVESVDIPEEYPPSHNDSFDYKPSYPNPNYVDPSTLQSHEPVPTLSPETAKALEDLKHLEWGPKETAGKGVLSFDDELLGKNKQVHDFIIERERAMYAASSDPRIQAHASWPEDRIIHEWKVRIGEIDGKIVDWGKGIHGGMYTKGVTYHPYIREDGTVGITGDEAHWKNGLYKFGAPEAPPKSQLEIVDPYGDDVPPLVEVPQPKALPLTGWEVKNIDTGHGAHNWHVPKSGIQEGTVIWRNVVTNDNVGDNQTHNEYMRWHETDPRTGDGEWVKTSTHEEFARSAGATPGEIPFAIRESAENNFNLTESEMNQVEKKGFINKDDVTYVRTGAGNVEPLSKVHAPAPVEKAPVKATLVDPFEKNPEKARIEIYEEPTHFRSLEDSTSYLTTKEAVNRFGGSPSEIQMLRNYGYILEHRNSLYTKPNALERLVGEHFKLDMNSPRAQERLAPLLSEMRQTQSLAVKAFQEGLEDRDKDAFEVQRNLRPYVAGLDSDAIDAINSGEFSKNGRMADLEDFERKTLDTVLGKTVESIDFDNSMDQIDRLSATGS